MSQNFSGPRNIILFLAIAVTLLILIYQNSITFEQKQESIRIGIAQWPGFEYLFIAKEMDYFKQVDLDIELIELSSLAEVRRAFTRGKVDGMATSLVEVLEAYKYSKKIAQPILVTDYSKGSDEILATKNITSISQLKGKKIGVEAGSISSYLVDYALELNNINKSEVVIFPMAFNKLPRALKAGKVDAITSYPPISIALKKQFDVNVIFDSSDISDNLLDVIAIDQEVLSKNPELQNRLIKAWELTLNYARDHPEESFQKLIERVPISTGEFEHAMEKIQLIKADEQNNYFSQKSMLKNYLTNIGSIIFKNTEAEIDYSIFLYQADLE